MELIHEHTEMDQNRKIRVGITHGDINGIGYEVILKTLSEPRMVELCTPIVYGSSKALSYHRKALELPNVNFNMVPRAEEAPTTSLKCSTAK